MLPRRMSAGELTNLSVTNKLIYGIPPRKEKRMEGEKRKERE